jgi:rod shape-determining protein MreC
MARNKVAWRRLIFVALIIVALALLTVSFRESTSGPVHEVQQAGVSALSPLQSWGSRIAKPFRDGYHYITSIWSANSEKQRLEAQLKALQGKTVQLQEQTAENERLKQLLDFRDNGIVANVFPTGTKFKVARVIAKSPSRWQAWVAIDKGTDDGIALNQPVVGATPSYDQSLYGKGLVGKIVAVSAHSAQVQLISDSESSVAAIIQGGRAEGILSGDISGKLTMDFVDRDMKVDKDSVIITSGFTGSSPSLFPKGIPIGVVTNVGEEDVNVYKQVEVQSFVDFRVLEEVMVLEFVSTATTDFTNQVNPESGWTGGTVESTTSTTARTATTATTATDGTGSSTTDSTESGGEAGTTTTTKPGDSTTTAR